MLFYFSQVIEKNLPILDGRGRHNSHAKVLVDASTVLHDFIVNLNARESHYSREKNTNKIYLPSNTTKSKLYREFLQQNPDYRPGNEENVRNTISYWFFCKTFNEDFNISIGYPLSELCNNCELFKKRIDVAQRNNQADLEMIQLEQFEHWDKAEYFYDQMKSSLESEDDHLIICCDFEKKFQHPLTGVNKEYFSSHMNISNFGIKNLKTGRAMMYFYPQNFANKGSNEIN